MPLPDEQILPPPEEPLPEEPSPEGQPQGEPPSALQPHGAQPPPGEQSPQPEPEPTPEEPPPTEPPPEPEAEEENPFQTKLDNYTAVQDGWGDFSELVGDVYGWAQKTNGGRDCEGEIFAVGTDCYNYRRATQIFEEMLAGDFGDTLEAAGIQVIPGTGGMEGNCRFILPGQGGDRVGREVVAAWLTEQTDSLGQRAADFESVSSLFDDLTSTLQDTGTDFEVDPFKDENGWTDFIHSAFGDLQDMGDAEDLLKSFHDLMPTSDYTAEALPDLTAPERMTKFFDDLKREGFKPTEYSGGADQQLRDFLYKKAQNMDPRNGLELDRSDFDRMAGVEVSELMKVIGRHSVLSEAEQKELVNAKMAPIRRREKEKYKAQVARLGAMGVGYGGSVARSTADLCQILGEAEMSTTADVYMQGIQMAEQGRVEAIKQLGHLSEAEVEIIKTAAGARTTTNGQYLGFLADIGRVSTTEYATKVEQHTHMADLELKAKLGIASMELEKYKTDTGLDMEKLRLDYENYWKDRGMTFEEKKQEFQDAIMSWKTSAEIADMVQTNNTDRLVQMTALAQRALDGDRDAQIEYQKMRLTNALQTRGFDIQQTEILADLTWKRYQLGENMDMTKWLEEHRSALQREMANLGFEYNMQLTEWEAEIERRKGGGGVLGALLDLGVSAAEIYANVQTGGAYGAAKGAVKAGADGAGGGLV